MWSLLQIKQIKQVRRKKNYKKSIKAWEVFLIVVLQRKHGFCGESSDRKFSILALFDLFSVIYTTSDNIKYVNLL